MTRNFWAVAALALGALTGCGEDDGDGGTTPPTRDALCPDAGRATLVLNFTGSSLTPTAADRLNWAFFTAMPPAGPPADTGTVTPPVALPVTATMLDVTPGTYAVTGCFDVAGDNMMDCAGAGDVSFVYPTGSMHTFAAGDVVELAINLTTPGVTLSSDSDVTTLGLEACP